MDKTIPPEINIHALKAAPDAVSACGHMWVELVGDVASEAITAVAKLSPEVAAMLKNEADATRLSQVVLPAVVDALLGPLAVSALMMIRGEHERLDALRGMVRPVVPGPVNPQ
jgi:hypothetical protein